MEQNHIQLLNELEKTGIGNKFNVSPFMIVRFNRPAIKDVTQGWDWEEEQRAKYFLYEMLNRRFIQFKGEDLEKTIAWLRLPANDTMRISQWFDNNDFFISLTTEGWDYLHDNKLKIATIKSYTWTKGLSIFAIIISVLTLGSTYYKDQEDNGLKDDIITQKTRLLNTEQKVKSIELRQLKPLESIPERINKPGAK